MLGNLVILREIHDFEEYNKEIHKVNRQSWREILLRLQGNKYYFFPGLLKHIPVHVVEALAVDMDFPSLQSIHCQPPACTPGPDLVLL